MLESGEHHQHCSVNVCAQICTCIINNTTGKSRSVKIETTAKKLTYFVTAATRAKALKTTSQMAAEVFIANQRKF